MASSDVSTVTDTISIPTTMSTDLNRCKTRVHFSKNPADIVVVLEEQTEPDRRARWYTAKDLYAMRREPVRAIKAFRLSKGDTSVLDDTKYCVRGLEDLLSYKLKLEKKKRQKCVVMCILEEQDSLRQMGTEDPKGLQMLSASITRWAKSRALNFGTQDAQEAAMILTGHLDFEESSQPSEDASTFISSDKEASSKSTLGKDFKKLDRKVHELPNKKDITAKLFHTAEPPRLQHREVASRSA
mmetsp:Transcript_6021/g.9272  ORF Transcript_6021/g.9272 Transcript_6021/m.9272 type:complete len:242 (+) Transcript_6021:28-753(+)